MKLKKQVSFTRNDTTGMAVFSGPKGHIVMARDSATNKYEHVAFTEDDDVAAKHLEG